MKKLLSVLAVALLIVACKPSKVEQLILTHEQTIGGTFTDLGMKIDSLTKVGAVTFNDSAVFYAQIIDSLKRKYYPKSNIDTIVTDSLVSKIHSLSIRFKSLYDKTADSFYFDKTKQWGDNYTELKDVVDRAALFSATPDSIIGYRYRCSYKIKNPFLDAVQTVKNEYLITPDESHIVAGKHDLSGLNL